MKILLFGKNGQLGWELKRSLLPLGEVIALGREEADFSKPESLRNIVRTIEPDVIINAAAYTAVDKAEVEEELATIINGVAPGVLAEEAAKINALLVHYSTDYVFDGAKSEPYTELDKPNPINAYGRTKLAGEQVIQSSACDHLIFRTSWVYSPRGHNFLLTMLRLAKDKDTLNIVSDQIGAPTPAKLIADITVVCIRQAMAEKQSGVFFSGLYHLTASGSISWYGFSKAIVSAVDKRLNLRLKVKNINAIPASDYPLPAKRPQNSRLLTDKLQNNFKLIVPQWKSELELCLDELLCNKL